MNAAASVRIPLSSSKRDKYAEEKPTSDSVQRMVEGAWSTLGPRIGQPGVLTGMLVVFLLVVVVWQHPLARALGTEKAVPALAPVTQATVGAAPPNPVLPTHPRGWHKLPQVTPRDPFKALLAATAASAAAASGTTQSASAASSGSSTSTTGSASTSGTGAGASGTSTGTGTGTGTGNGGSTQASGSHSGSSGSVSPNDRCFATHVVQPGESLWSISNDRLLSHGFHSVNRAWHALYAANRSTIGADPSYLLAGEKLCLPKA